MSYSEILESELQSFQIQLPKDQKADLSWYCEEVDRWNQRLNLTGLSGYGLVRRLVVEPVWIARQLVLAGTLTDIGSGNGSPAIPFQIVSSLETCHLIESRVKRAAFLRHVAATLRLSQVAVHRARFGDIAGSLGKADWISLQGVTMSGEILDGIRMISTRRTTIVWITSRLAEPPFRPFATLTIPMTQTEVHLFRLDLS